MQESLNQSSIIPVGELIVSRERVSLQTIVSTVSDQFFSIPELDALAVVDEDNVPQGLITRSKLFFTLSRRYGNELYSRQPILTISDTQPLIVADDELLDEVIDKAFNRPQQNIYDEIIVTDRDGKYAGLLSVKQLVVQQSNALTRSLLLEEIASDRARELERINHVKTKFLTNVTHELRSPVNAIIGLAELLRIAFDDGTMELARERLSFMITTASNLRTVITNILDMSKIEAGKMEVSRQLVDVVLLLSEITETTRILVAEKPVKVTMMAPSEPVNISTDPIKLRQIVTNLTSNAAKFTEKGCVDIIISTLKGGLTIEVRDTGIGIKEEDLNLIFDAFGQVEDATTKSHEGSGLGLTISNNLANLLGGFLSVTSIYGKGSSFLLTLPLAQSDRQGVLSHAA